MKSTPVLCMAFAAVLTLSAVSCDKGTDESSDPAGTTTLNMMNEASGKTLLGDSDAYIDKVGNFYGSSCSFSDLGVRGGLGSMPAPALDGIADQVAVQTGHAYQLFKTTAVREFPSGKRALAITADYYNVYVVSEIKKEDAAVGAVVKYVLSKVPTYGMPEYGSNLGRLNNPYDELRIDLPTSDFEYELVAQGGAGPVELEKKGKTLFAHWPEYNVEEDYNIKQGDFSIYIRIGGSYTYVRGVVQ